MKKVIVNLCFGGWSLSKEACNRLEAIKGVKVRSYDKGYRDDSDLVAIVEELGEAANGECAKLFIDEVPDGYDYSVEEYDGMERVRLHVNEEYLRELIRRGIEDEIVEYVMATV